MKIRDFYYDSDNNQDLVYAKCWLPESNPIGVIQLIHGMTEHSGRYEDFANYFTSKGFVCTMNDHLGHGKTVAKTRGFFGFKHGIDHLLNDVNALKETTQDEFKGLPYFFLGISMGTFIERMLIARPEVTQNLTGAVIAAAALDKPETKQVLEKIKNRINKTGPKVVDHELIEMIFNETSNAFANENDSLAWVTSNLGRREQYRNDKQSNFSFTNAGLRDLMSMLIQSNQDDVIESTDPRLPLLFISGKDDPIGDFGKAVREIACRYLLSGTDDLAVKIFPKVRHDVLFDFPATQNRAFSCILNWINAHLINYRNIR